MPLAALLPLLIGVAPQIVSWIAGDRAGTVATQVGNIVQAVVGSDDPDAVQAALSDPAKASELRIRLAEIGAEQEQARRQADLDELKAVLSDTASARAQTVALVQAGSGLRFGPVIVSTLVLTSFAAVVVLALFKPLPAGSEALLNILLGNLSAMAMGVVGYWVGSSAGSAAKTDMIRGGIPGPLASPAPGARR